MVVCSAFNSTSLRHLVTLLRGTIEIPCLVSLGVGAEFTARMLRLGKIYSKKFPKLGDPLSLIYKCQRMSLSSEPSFSFACSRTWIEFTARSPLLRILCRPAS